MQEDLVINKLWHNLSLPFKIDIVLDDDLISPVNKYDDWTNIFKKENPSLTKNEINKNGFRSDNFINNHKGKHILFAGCSYTWGVGLSIDEVWSKKTYNKISSKEMCSGFFNIGIPGSSIINQIFYIFKYCKIYGNPNIIFFNIPDLKRFYFYNNKEKNFYEGGYSGGFIQNIIEFLSFQYYYMLEQYCNTNNIKLYSFSWYNAENSKPKFITNSIGPDNILNKFNTFYSYSTNQLIDFVFDYKNNNKNDKFLELARDAEHLGTAYHAFWSDFIVDKLKD